MLNNRYQVCGETYQQLYNRCIELLGYSKQYPTVSFMHRERFEKFRESNSLHLQIILDKEARLRAAHCIPAPTEPGQQPQYQLEQDPDTGQLAFAYKTPEDKAEFKKQWDDLMSRQIK